MTTVNFDEMELVTDLLFAVASVMDTLGSLASQPFDATRDAEFVAGSFLSFAAARRRLNFLAGPAEEIPPLLAVGLAHAVEAVADLRGYINTAFQNELATPVMTQVPIEADSAITKEWDFSLTAQGGEAVVAEADEQIKVLQLADGQFEVVMVKGGSLGIGGKVGVADGSIGGQGSIEQTWYTGSFADAQRLALQLGMTTGPVGTIINGLAGFRAAQIPPPASQSDFGGIKGSLDVGTPGASATSTSGTVGGGASAGASVAVGITKTGSTLSGTYSFAGDAQAVLGSNGVSATSAAASVSADLNASVVLNGADKGAVKIDGSFTASGSVDVNGEHINPASGDNAVMVRFSADVDPSKVSADVRAALSDLNGNDPEAVGTAVRTLLKDGITVNYSAYSGQLDAAQFSAPGASGSTSFGSWSQIPGASGRLTL